MNHPIILLLRFTWRYAKGRRHIFFITVLSFVVGNAILILEPAVIGKMLNVVQEGGQGMAFFWEIFAYLLLVLAIPVIFWAFHGPGRVWERKTAFHIDLNYKRDLLKQVFSLPISWHKDHHSGENIDKINRAAQNLEDFSARLFEPIQAIIKLFGAYIALFIIMPLGGFIAVGVSVIAITSSVFFDRVLIRQYKEVYRLKNRVASTIHDFVSNIVTVISMRLEKIGISQVVKRINDIFPTFRKSIIVNEVKWFSVSFIVAVMIFVVLVSNVYLTLSAGDVVLVGTLYSLYAYLERVSTAFYNFTYLYGQMIEQGASVQAAETITEAAINHKKQLPHALPKHWKLIEISKLSFSHADDPKHKNHVENFNLHLKRGAKIALVGTSGGGKSTTMSLLRGIQYTPNVTVKIGGKKMPHGLQHLYEATTLLPQEPEIFADTIEYNITMGKKVTKKDLDKAIKMSRFEPVLKRLEKGLKTNIAEKGVNLSGGEKQRLALARGLLTARKTPIVLMDEPTSSVDPKNELLIIKRVFKEYKQKTIIASVHRLHLLEMFDYIYVIDEGKIIEEGSLGDLLAQKGVFEKRWREYFKSHKHWKV